MENIKETIEYDGRKIEMMWHSNGAILPGVKVSQVSGFCADRGGKVLIIKNKRGWGIPGGHTEEGETLKQTLVREVDEEGAVSINFAEIFGFVEVNDPDNFSIEGKHYLQVRFIALITDVKDFGAAFETDERRFVAIDELPEYISWLKSPVGKAQYETFLKKFRDFIK